MSSLTAILGTIIGLSAGNFVEAADKYILAAVAGTFIYVSLGLLLPQLTHIKNGKSRVPEMILMIVGIGSMIGLSFVEMALEGQCGGGHSH